MLLRGSYAFNQAATVQCERREYYHTKWHAGQERLDVETSVIIWSGLPIDSTVVSTAGYYRAFVPFVLITTNHELWIKLLQ